MRNETGFAGALAEAKDAGKERGRNVHLNFVMRRHEDPKKLESGMSADFLTEAGVAHAKETGANLQADYLMVAGSKGVNRARETGGHILGAFRDEQGMAAVVNKTMSAGRQKDLGHGELPPGDVVIYRSGDLDPVKNFGVIAKEAKEKGNDTIEKQIQYWLDNPQRAKELGLPTSVDVARDMAHRINIGLRMSGKLFEGVDVKFENLTHGPKIEALLKEILVDGSKVGFNDMSEIGGMIKPGEAVEFDVKRKDANNVQLKIKLRGKEYAVDMDRLADLQLEYAKLHPKKEVK